MYIFKYFNNLRHNYNSLNNLLKNLRDFNNFFNSWKDWDLFLLESINNLKLFLYMIYCISIFFNFLNYNRLLLDCLDLFNLDLFWMYLNNFFSFNWDLFYYLLNNLNCNNLFNILLNNLMDLYQLRKNCLQLYDLWFLNHFLKNSLNLNNFWNLYGPFNKFLNYLQDRYLLFNCLFLWNNNLFLSWYLFHFLLNYKLLLNDYISLNNFNNLLNYFLNLFDFCTFLKNLYNFLNNLWNLDNLFLYLWYSNRFLNNFFDLNWDFNY